MAKQEKHIIMKDKADKTAEVIRNSIENLRRVLNIKAQGDLLDDNDKPVKLWYKAKISNLSKFNLETRKIAKEESKNLKKEVKSRLNALGISKKEALKVANDVEAKANTLGNVFIRQHNRWMNDIKTKALTTERQGKIDSLHSQIKKTFSENNQISGLTVKSKRTYHYKDGRVEEKTINERWESYIERNVRTEVHRDIAKGLVDAGAELNIVFYLASYFGDSRKEHEEYQGKIFYDKDWESFDIPEDVKEKIDAYIKSNGLISVQEVQSDDIGLGTWCNCRHSFTYVPIDDVLDVKSEKDLNNLREDYKMNFNGKYEKAKNKALNEQRYNERNIKAWKEKRDLAELELSKLGEDATDKEKLDAMTQVVYARNKVKAWQKKQRQHISNWENLRRDYARENPNDIYDMGEKLKVEKPNNGSSSELEKKIDYLKNADKESSKDEYTHVTSSFKFTKQSFIKCGVPPKAATKMASALKKKMKAHCENTGHEYGYSVEVGVVVLKERVNNKTVYSTFSGYGGDRNINFLDTKDENGVTLRQAMVSRDIRDMYFVHSHRSDTPPSVADLAGAGKKMNKICMTHGNAGSVYKYINDTGIIISDEERKLDELAEKDYISQIKNEPNYIQLREEYCLKMAEKYGVRVEKIRGIEDEEEKK